MRGDFSFLRKILSPAGKRKTEDFLIIDIGTEAVKVLAFRRSGGKEEILASSFQYLEFSGVLNGLNMEAEILKKALGRAIGEIEMQAGKKLRSVIISPPPDVFRAVVSPQVFIREKPGDIIGSQEDRDIRQKVLEGVKRDVAGAFSGSSGIMPEEIHFVDFGVMEMKINGYFSSSLAGSNGKRLDFKVLSTFIPKKSWQNIRTVIESLGIGSAKTIHLVQALAKHLDKYPDGVFIDIGGEITQIILARDGQVKRIDIFSSGGKNISRDLSHVLGIDYNRVRDLQAGYAKGDLSEGSRTRIKEIIDWDIRDWFHLLKEKLKKGYVLLPADMYLFGGASFLPDIQEILEEGNWDDVSIAAVPPRIHILKPQDIGSFGGIIKRINSTEYTSPILLTKISGRFSTV